MTVFLSNRDGNGKTNEEGHYRLQTRILSGFNLETNDLKVTENSPLGLSVLVSAGDYRLDSGTGYSYTGWLDAPATVTIPTAAITNPRISLIVIYVDKQATTTASPPNNPGITKLMAVQGTASSTPTPPSASAIQSAVGSGNPYYVLASVLVGPSATQVTNSNITDMREKMRLSPALLNYNEIYNNISNLLYPVGSIYTNASSSENPGTLLGFGTWTRFGQSRVLVGQDDGDTDFATLGATGGAKTHTLTEGQMPSHYHQGGTDGAGAHSHSYYRTNGQIIRRISNNNDNNHGFNDGGYDTQTSGVGNHAHSFTTNSKGNNQPHNNLQPYVVVYMWRRTA